MTPSAEAKPLPEVERYGLRERDANGDFDAHMEKDANGVWISFSTFDAHTTALKEAVRVLRKYVAHHRNCGVHVGNWHATTPDEVCTCGASQALADTAQWEK